VKSFIPGCFPAARQRWREWPLCEGGCKAANQHKKGHRPRICHPSKARPRIRHVHNRPRRVPPWCLFCAVAPI